MRCEWLAIQLAFSTSHQRSRAMAAATATTDQTPSPTRPQGGVSAAAETRRDPPASPPAETRSVTTRPRTRASSGPIAKQLLALIDVFARSQRELVVVAAEFADSAEWVLAGATNPARWLADACEVEVCTAREWIRIGRRLLELPVIADAYADGALSYSKVRTLTRVATPDSEADLLEYDHDPDYSTSHRTVTDELELRCAPCHQHRHRQQAA
jgi:hypothetical protein